MALLDALALTEAIRLADGQDPLRLYAQARRWHGRAYQRFSAAFTPQYQSDSRWLSVLRDRLLFPLSQLPPLPRGSFGAGQRHPAPAFGPSDRSLASFGRKYPRGGSVAGGGRKPPY